MAGDTGNARGQFNYGSLLVEYSESDKDLSEASKYLKMSADRGLWLARICETTGSARLRGLGVAIG
jgi:TPR repeat protein